MEVIKRYPQIDDMISALTRTANNLDKLLEIMTTTSIKMDPEKARSVLNEWYGNMVMDEVHKKFWSANEIGKKDDEIQDLKLENDLLKKRDKIMLKFVRSASCKGMACGNCLFFDDSYPVGKKCIYNRYEIFADISNAAEDVLEELDNL